MANWPSRVDYRLPDAAAVEVNFFSDHVAHLSRIVSSAHKLQPKPSLQDIIEAIAEDTEMQPEDVRIIINSLENIRQLAEDLGSVEEGVSRLSLAVSRETAAKLDNNKKIIADAIRDYGYDNPVTITIKAQRLTYAREKLVHDAEIITDARPIFDKSGSKILEYIVTHTLMIGYMVDGNIRQRYLSLDNADIINLRQACDRAIGKARTLKEAIGSADAPAVIVRDETSTGF